MGGDSVAVLPPGLPNIEGYESAGGAGIERIPFTCNGVFTHEGISGIAASGGTVINTYKIRFNASLSNSIYGASTTVQPPAIQLLPQIKY